MEYLIHLAILIGIYGILGLSLNLVVGYTGLLSITHAAFYGLGAYVTAILSLIIGAILSRFRGDYYALGSFGFNVILFSIFLNWQEVTRGPLGIPGIARPEIDLRFMIQDLRIVFSSNWSFLILTACFLLLCYLLSRFIVNSSFGRVLKAIREDEEGSQGFGYHTSYYKL